jgi:predicted NBD/HSP70 family sugar kinase
MLNTAAANAGQESLREHNLALVFGQLMAHAADLPSRADLAQMTGLSRATLSAIVAQLIELRLVAEVAAPVARGVGRPAVPLAPAGRTIVGFGLEVNVDYMGLRAVDLCGEAVEEWVEQADFRGSDPAEVLGRLFTRAAAAAAKLHAGGMRLAGAGLALPGIADHPQGPLRLAPNLGWRETDVVAIARAAVAGAKARGVAAVRPLLQRGLVERLTVGNEAKLAAQAEGAGRGESFLYLSGQAGIGAAIVVDGAMFRGRHGWSGEIGHIVVEPGGRPCACGARGCLERYAGTQAILAEAGLEPGGGLGPLLGQLDEPGQAGERARSAVAAAGEALGSALAGAINLLDIPAMVIGGQLAPLTAALAPHILAKLDDRVLSARWTAAEFDIRPAQGGRHAALTGGAGQALARVISNPASLLA